MKTSILNFLKKNIVMEISFILALITMFFVPLDEKYLSYFDFKTLTCLFCTLAIINALKNIDFFYILAQKIVFLFKDIRLVVLMITYITFIGSMIIANDMALLTFLPLSYFVLKNTKKEKYMAFVFIMQNIAANLGGMLTPFGNPQNLYLYTKFNIPTSQFISIMAFPFIISILLITLSCLLFVKKEPLKISGEIVKLNYKKTIIYLLLFVFSIIIVFRIFPYQYGLIIILFLIVLDYKSLLKVDYPLLLTFVFFFIFAGNMARIEIIKNFFIFLLEKSTFLVSVFSCQFISNVPSAILLSQFTDNYKELLLGVNIGGIGTLISSLASLITLREYTKNNPSKVKQYIGLFSLFNFSFLIILIVSTILIL